jgi:hypothetical protein
MQETEALLFLRVYFGEVLDIKRNCGKTENIAPAIKGKKEDENLCVKIRT